MDNLKTWWNGLILREQQLVGTCGGFLLLAVLYWGIWTPIVNAESDAERGLLSQQNTLSFVKQTANKITGLKQSDKKTNFSGSLTTAVNHSAGMFGLEITRLQPQGDKVQIWMDDVPFDVLLGYLNELVQVKGISLDSIDLAESDLPGLVKVRRIQLSQ